MHNFLKTILLLMLGASLPVLAEGNGGFSGGFLRIGLGARAQAMGNAQVATADNGYGAYYNPAALPNMEKRQLSLSYSDLSLDRRFNFIGFALPLKPFAGASVGYISSGVDDLRSYNSNGEDTGPLDHGSHAIYASFALRVLALAQADGQLTNLPADLVSVGLSVKFLKENLDDNEEFNYSGSGLGFDFGLLIKPISTLAIGYQIRDVKSNLRSNTNDLFERGAQIDNKFPTTQRLGLFYRLPVSWAAVAYDFEWSDAGENKHHVGVELSSSVASGRLGYDNDHITLGGGLEFRAFNRLNMVLDYAFVSDVVDEGISHVFSWRFLF